MQNAALVQRSAITYANNVTNYQRLAVCTRQFAPKKSTPKGPDRLPQPPFEFLPGWFLVKNFEFIEILAEISIIASQNFEIPSKFLSKSLEIFEISTRN